MLKVYFAQARMYDPQAKSFMAEDPARDVENCYSYCYDNPVQYTDPSGEIAIEAGYFLVACVLAIGAWQIYQASGVAPALAKQMQIVIDNIKYNCYKVNNLTNYKNVTSIGYVAGPGAALVKTYAEVVAELEYLSVISTFVGSVSGTFTTVADNCAKAVSPSNAGIAKQVTDMINIENAKTDTSSREKYKYCSAYVDKSWDSVVPIAPLTLTGAVAWINNILSHEDDQGVIAINREAATELVNNLGGLYREDIKNNDGYLPHMHPKNKDNAHIWYIG